MRNTTATEYEYSFVQDDYKINKAKREKELKDAALTSPKFKEKIANDLKVAFSKMGVSL